MLLSLLSFLIVGGFYSEVTLQKREARRYGGQEEQRRPRVAGSAGATQDVPCDLRPPSDRTGCTVANGGESVPEGPEKAPAKLEGVVAVVVIPESPMRLDQRSVRWAMMKRRRRNSPFKGRHQRQGASCRNGSGL